jgi:hypothetical protein
MYWWCCLIKSYASVVEGYFQVRKVDEDRFFSSD